jgi:hypothetical protein
MKLDTPWYWAALAAIVPAGAAVGTGGLFAGHAAIMIITLGIFFGTLSIGKHASPQTASATPIPPAVGDERKALAGLSPALPPLLGDADVLDDPGLADDDATPAARRIPTSGGLVASQARA